MKGNQRIQYLDLLRVFGSFAVVVSHVACQFSGVINVHTKEWMYMNIYIGVVQWCVPVFVMISGACLLGRGIELKRILKKNIVHLLIVFLVWSSIYAGIEMCKESKVGIEFFVSKIIFGHYHMWFLYMLMGLYLIIPILDCIIEHRNVTTLFLGLGFVFNFVLPWIYMVIGKFSGPLVGAVLSAVANMKMQLIIGYSFYFVLGYVLNRIDLSCFPRWILYVLGILGGVATVLLTRYMSYKSGSLNEEYYNFLTLNVCLQSVAVFVLAKEFTAKSNKFSGRGMTSFLSKCSLGVYLIHPMILEYLNGSMKINALSFNPAIWIPIFSGILFFVSILFIWLLKRIPIVGDYLV